MTPRLLPYGDRALLVELADAAEVLACADVLRADASVGELVADVVPGARTVLLVAAPGVGVEQLMQVPIGAGLTPPPSLEASETIEIEVSYDGPDLADVARLTGLSEDEVVVAHTGTPWRVAFGGFAPGFAYLVGGDPRLDVPRRETPRTRVPAGSVGLAGEFSGIYPRASPGGWQLVGRADVALWDLDRDPPALLAAGSTVRFVAR
ncbi:MAG TPA: allophanate hydrolase subunit 1 [Nocardioides sp.]|nr:allophanate hydrolase subunit 1 [Nocardioides sp.]